MGGNDIGRLLRRADDFRRIFDAAPTPYLVLSPTLAVVAVNEAYLKATATRRDDILGQSVFDIFPSDADDPTAGWGRDLRASLERVLGTGQADTMAVQKHGIRRAAATGGAREERWWSPVNVPVFDDRQRIICLIHRVEDVTGYIGGLAHLQQPEQPTVEAAKRPAQEMELFGRNLELHEAVMREQVANRHLRLALKAGHAGTFEWQALTDRCIWSDELLALYGLETFGGRYQDWLDCVVPEDRAAARDAVQHANRSGEIELEFRIRRRDNDAVRWMHGRAEVHRDAAGQATRMIGIQMDITEHRQAEAQMREQAMLLDLTPDPTMVWEEGNGLRYWNHGCEQVYGYSRQEALGRSPQMLLKTVFPASLEAFYAELRRAGKWSGELRHITRDGRELVVESWMRRLTIDGKEVVLEATRDVTERKRLESKLRRMNAALEERIAERTAELTQSSAALERSNLELQQFAFVAAHDLQTPLRAIKGFAQLLYRDYHDRLDSRADGWIDQILTSAQRMHELIHDLLAYARVDSRGQSFQPTDIRRLFEEVVSTLAEPIRDTGAQVTCGDLPEVMADRCQLAQVLQNLIDNALKYRGSDPPRVHVSAWRQDGDWVFSVRDNGIGIAEKHQERIFAIFQRLHTQQEYPGTGIGLAICRRVVHRHGGRIWVESTPGKGSTFYFTLPDRTPTAS